MKKFFIFQNDCFKINRPCWYYEGHRCYPLETDKDCQKCCEDWWKENKNVK